MAPDAAAPRTGTDPDSSRTDPNRQVRGDERRELTEYVTAEYLKGQSIRDIASTIGRSYGFVHRLLTEGGVELRTRGGARKRSRR
ncbi:helix-turn-helix domain-containing protein [Glycomyces xiaoerkulensis]|uniref:helix-turn-helix domain-containing protein n=1 Tax=Glycomyces xiaoerkulensis TaxID=2038139 RepID=UPI000C267465|nr:helix-turn-helix domain-containing protein [Glycomyces xiaoerkulensis]